jgi:acyl-CoA thioesterase-1
MEKINFKSLFVILLIILCGCARPEIPNLNNKGANIICFGDSITFGYGANPGEDYPTVLSNLVSAPVINAGVDGDTTFEALARIESDVLSKDPYLVIVEFGGNDFLRKVPKADTIKNLGEVIERIHQHGAIVALVDISAGFFFQEYRAAFKKLAKDKKTIFVPVVLTNIITNPAMKSDFFHPNARGYQMIAKRVYQAIAPYLKK